MKLIKSFISLIYFNFWLIGRFFSFLYWVFRKVFKRDNSDEDAQRRLFKKEDRDALLAEHYVGRGYYKCPRCKKTKRKKHMHIDHIIPYSKGGATSIKNAQVLCMTCNISKGNRHSIFEEMRGERRR